MSATAETAVLRTRVGRVPLAVAAAIAIAWMLAIAAQASGTAALIHHDQLVEHGPAPLIALPLFVVTWQAMTAAMMLPSSLPLVRLFAAASAGQPHAPAAMAAFLGGYALVWSGFGAAAFVGDLALHRLVDQSPWLAAHDWLIGGGVLAAAGAFQFSRLKHTCLDKCRHPGAFLMRHYARGPSAAFRLGRRHGVFCLGCCWALMLVMFAVGVANLVWMAALTALMVHEKTRPAGRRAVPVTGAVLLGAASVVLAYGAWAGAGL